MTSNLERLLAACPAEDLLPARRIDEAGRVRAPITVLGWAAFSDQHPYLLVEDARGVRYGVPAVIANGRLRRAQAGDGHSEALIGLLAGVGTGDVGLEVTAVRAMSVHGERAIDVDQTNELVTVGGEAVVKWLLHPSGGDEPGPRRLQALAAAGFAGTPQTWGFAHLVDGDQRFLIAAVAACIPQTQDGWEWAVSDVRSLAFGGLSRSAALEPVRAIAALVARMHVAFSTAGVDHATEAQAQQWLATARADLDDAQLDPDSALQARPLLQPLGDCTGTPIIDVHGDLHVGQILRSAVTGSYFVIDFDGNPTQPLEERDQRQPGARDVATMLASLDHVGRVVLHRTDGLEDAQERRVLDWIVSAQEAFLVSYREVLDAHARGDLLDESLLVAMQVQQECREYSYARRYLPHWRYVPDAALPALLMRSRHES